MNTSRTAALVATLVCITALAACASPTTRNDVNSPSPLHGQPGSIAVLVFGAIDCPIANAYAPEIERISLRCTGLGVPMTYVYPASDITDAAVIAHAREFGLTMPHCLDPSHAIVRAVGATVTPEAAVIRFGDDDRVEVLYLGRIDDWYADLGKRRVRASTHDLLDAIDAARDGRTPAPARTHAFGCFIERTP